MKAGRVILVLMIAFALTAVPLGSYVGAYIVLGEYIDWRGVVEEGMPTNSVERSYPAHWMTEAFRPAAYVESLWMGVPVISRGRRFPVRSRLNWPSDAMIRIAFASPLAARYDGEARFRGTAKGCNERAITA
jgi:hypothetical protein